MGQIWWPAVGFALLIVIQSISSDLEGNIGELHFTIPDAMLGFSDAASLCKNYYNSTLAVVNDSHSQTALTQFLNSTDRMSPWPMYINIRLHKRQNNSWFLVNGSRYDGDIGNQDLPAGSLELKYLLYGHLNHNGNNFVVNASTPSYFRNYICDYKKEESCSDESANFIVNNGRCFVKYENESLTWFEARQRCVSNGGDLARFQSDPNDEHIPPFNTSWLNKSLTYWVGIRWNHLSWKSPWGGQETIFTSWSKDEPNYYNNECVCVDPNKSLVWSWTDCDCSIARQFVCLKRIVVQTQTPLTATPIEKVPIAANTAPAVIKLATSFKIKPYSIAALTSRPKDPATEFNLVIDNKPSTTEGKIEDATLAVALDLGWRAMAETLAQLKTMFMPQLLLAESTKEQIQNHPAKLFTPLLYSPMIRRILRRISLSTKRPIVLSRLIILTWFLRYEDKRNLCTRNETVMQRNFLRQLVKYLTLPLLSLIGYIQMTLMKKDMFTALNLLIVKVNYRRRPTCKHRMLDDQRRIK